MTTLFHDSYCSTDSAEDDSPQESFSEKVRGQAAKINAMMDENQSIRELIASRREIMQQQQRADQIKSELCDRLRAEKMKVPGLDRRVKRLETEDPELYKYIRKLEFVQDGIWCPRCNIVKNIGAVAEPPREKVSNGDGIRKLRDDCEDLEAKCESLLSHMDIIRIKQNKHIAKLRQSAEIIAQLDKELRELHTRARGLRTGSAQSAVSSMDNATYITTRLANNEIIGEKTEAPREEPKLAIKKEDLPAKPRAELFGIPPEKILSIGTISAEELLG